MLVPYYAENPKRDHNFDNHPNDGFKLARQSLMARVAPSKLTPVGSVNLSIEPARCQLPTIPRAPCMCIVPTFGPKVCKYGLLWAIWSPRGFGWTPTICRIDAFWAVFWGFGPLF